MIRPIRYILEALLLCVLFVIFKCMPAESASNFGGWLGRKIGPKLAASRKAYRNLERAMPELSHGEEDVIIADMWENLGRVIAEYPHLHHISKNNTEIIGTKHLQTAKDPKTNAVFISSHSANWEINCVAPLLQMDIQMDATYRAPNNKWVYKILKHLRSMGGRIKAYPKSRGGGRALIKAVKNKRNVAFLIDQKYNEGYSIPFFSRDAMTTPVFVQLAQKHNLKIIPVQNIRLEGANFKLIVHEPIAIFGKDGRNLPIEDVMLQANQMLESWIKDNPGQWLWLHRRWKD